MFIIWILIFTTIFSPVYAIQNDCNITNFFSIVTFCKRLIFYIKYEINKHKEVSVHGSAIRQYINILLFFITSRARENGRKECVYVCFINHKKLTKSQQLGNIFMTLYRMYLDTIAKKKQRDNKKEIGNEFANASHTRSETTWIFYTASVPNKFAEQDKTNTLTAVVRLSSIGSDPKTFEGCVAEWVTGTSAIVYVLQWNTRLPRLAITFFW